MPKYVIDSWAWVEYLEGTEKGEIVRKYVLDEKNEIYTNLISLAEIISVVSRKGLDTNIAFNAVSTSSILVNIDENFCKEAGIFHGTIRKTVKDFGLGDTFVTITAHKLRAQILTGDPHFKGMKETVML